MMRIARLPVFFLLLACAAKLSAADYPVSDIADSLKTNAGAVVRLNNVTVNIHSTTSVSYIEERVVTILNASQEDEAEVKIWYDDKLAIKSFKAWLYDAAGNVVKRFEKKDAEDYSAGGDNLASNSRIKVWDMRKLQPPFTVKYVYETESAASFFLPHFMPAEEAGISIEQAQFTVNCDGGLAIKTRANKVLALKAGPEAYQWQVSGFCAVKNNQYAPGIWPALPHVFIMARQFEMYGVQGSSDSWNDIGLFMNKLTLGRDALAKLDDPKLNAAIALQTSDRNKIREIYKYLQGNFRYVSIQLGIGGWQPQQAAFTMDKKYGDCKALSMVMKAMLKKAGIASYLTLINTRKNRIDLAPDFPNSYFDHVILCVPLPNDTIWLECTSSVTPFNYLGSFTSNRKALMIVDKGAQVVTTPAYTELFNVSSSKSLIKLNDDKSVTISAMVSKQGELQDDLSQLISLKDSKRIESDIYNISHIKNTTINSYAIVPSSPDTPRVTYNLQLTNEYSIKKTDARMFVRTDLFDPVAFVPERETNRRQQVKVGTGFTQTDTLIYNLPLGYVPENFDTLDTKVVIARFGDIKCRVTYSAESGALQLVRNFCLKQDTYAPEDYTALRDFLLKASKQCCPELVLKKKG